MINLILLICSAGMVGYRPPAANKIEPGCGTHVWVYFTDKGIGPDEYGRALAVARNNTRAETLNRRAKRGTAVGFGDLALSEDYLDAVADAGGLLIRRSRWLNAASFYMDRAAIERVAQLPFVCRITGVARYHGQAATEETAQADDSYGHTLKQSQMFNIDTLHRLGVTGSGVKVGFLDTGLRRIPAALDNIKLVAEYDFLGGDQIFCGSTAVTPKYGIISGLAFHRTPSSAINLLFFDSDTLTNYTPSRDIFFVYSTDEGSSWSPAKKITSNFADWASEITVCGDDTIFGFYRDKSGLEYFVMRDTAVISPPSFFAGDSTHEPTAVEIDDTVYAFYHRKSRLAMRRGTSAGFNPEETVDSTATAIKDPVAVGSDTLLGVFFCDRGGDSLFLLRTALPVAAFSKEFIAIGRKPEAACVGETLWLAYFDSLLRVCFVKSADFGGSFSAPVVLSDFLGSAGDLSLAKTGARIIVSWQVEGRIYFKTSIDNGTSFGGPDSLGREFVYKPLDRVAGSNLIKFFCQRGDSNTDGYLSTDADYGHPRHGTEMLGLVAGFLKDTYVGVAPGCQVMVAKTENPNRSYEFPVEEDTWISGLEWLEAQGADIVSSSLGYTDWYRWPVEYDGKTSAASIAASEAVRRGLVITNASGNFSTPMEPQIVVPGDAEGVITVGGIDTLFNHAKWTSQTNTAYAGYWLDAVNHAVKKPEVVCLCAAPIVVEPDSVNFYLYSYGTSGATAMTAGICALLLEGHPFWNADSIRRALLATASLAAAPCDSMGYGWPDALAAFYYTQPAWDPIPGNRFLPAFPNPFIPAQQPNLYIPFKLQDATSVEFRIYSPAGRLVRKTKRPAGAGQLAPGVYDRTDPNSTEAAFIWDGTDEQGRPVGSGLYYGVLLTHGFGTDLVKFAVVR